MIGKIDRNPEIRIIPDDWKNAEKAVAGAKRQNDQSTNFKISYKAADLNHSLHQVNGVTWMAPRWPYVAATGFTKTQKVVNQSGEPYTLKTYRVEEAFLKQIEESEHAIDAVYGRLKFPPVHRYERVLTRQQPFYKGALATNPALTEQTAVKVRHELQPWAGDHNLHDILDRIDEGQKLLAAIKMAIEVAKLHAFGIVLRNVDTSNARITFKNTSEVKKEDDEFDLKIADFSYAVVLAKEQDAKMVANKYGKNDFLAPEALTGTVSRETDIYSLGVIFRNQLDLGYDFIDEMLDEEWQERPNALDVVKQLMYSFDVNHYVRVVKPQIFSDLTFLQDMQNIVDIIDTFKNNKELASDFCLQKLREIVAAAPDSPYKLIDALREIVNNKNMYEPTISPVFQAFAEKVYKFPLKNAAPEEIWDKLMKALVESEETIMEFGGEKKSMRM